MRQCYKASMEENAISRAVKKAGGVRVVADALRLSKAAIYMYINGDREPSDKFLEYIGLEKEVRYVRA